MGYLDGEKERCREGEGERTKFAVIILRTGTQFGYKKSALLPGQCRLGIQVMPALGVRSDRTDWVEKRRLKRNSSARFIVGQMELGIGELTSFVLGARTRSRE